VVSPDKVQARKLVLVSVLLLAVISVYRDRRRTDSAGTFRVFWGVGVVGMFLSLLADFLPTIAGPFAVLVVLGSLTNGGDKALQSLLGAIVPQTPAGSSTTARSGSSSPATPTPATR
jgi:hypothetical protein